MSREGVMSRDMSRTGDGSRDMSREGVNLLRTSDLLFNVLVDVGSEHRERRRK